MMNELALKSSTLYPIDNTILKLGHPIQYALNGGQNPIIPLKASSDCALRFTEIGKCKLIYSIDHQHVESKHTMVKKNSQPSAVY